MSTEAKNFLRYRARAILLSLGLGLATAQAGCALLFVPDVDDLQLVDVQSVRAGTLDLHDIRGHKRPPQRVLGKISIATSSDLHGIGKEHELNILGGHFVSNTVRVPSIALKKRAFGGVAE